MSRSEGRTDKVLKPTVVLAFLLVSCMGGGEGGESKRPRIVSLLPNATEIIFALGMGGHLVGATRYCDRPEEALKVKRVGGILDVSVEAVIGARPDLVIGSEAVLRGRLEEVLREIGAKTLPLTFETPESVIEGILAIGAAIGKEKEAEALVASYRKDLEALSGRCLRNPKIKVLFVAGINPLVVAGPRSYLGMLLERMGVENVVKGSVTFPTWSMEQVLEAQPDVVVDGASEGEDLSSLLASASVRAVVVRVEDRALLRPGPGTARAAQRLADSILAAFP